MKMSSIIRLGQTFVTCLALPALGQSGPGARNFPDPAQFGQPVRATEIIGSTIKNSRDEKLGTVKDVALDLQNGRVVEMVVACGGFLSLDQKLVAVPAQFFNAEAGHKTLRSSLDKDKLEGAPAVDLFNWSEATDQSHVKEVYHYFGAKPYFLEPEFFSKNGTEVQRAVQLVHAATLNHRDQNLGNVEDLIVDLPAGRVIEVVIASGRILGIKDELSPVPPQAVRFNSQRDILMLHITATALADAPHFPARAWPRIDREQAFKVYQAYNVMPYFMPIGVDEVGQFAGVFHGNNGAISVRDAATFQATPSLAMVSIFP
jgi:sporulation protein YlmC with PRC-barrel domain